jgi:hypothetical protein
MREFTLLPTGATEELLKPPHLHGTNAEEWHGHVNGAFSR